MKDLNEIRTEIDEVDRDIVSLYEKRMELSSEVAAYKIANHKNVFDKQREEQKLATLSGLVDDAYLKQGVTELFEQIMSLSRKKQYKLLAENGVTPSLSFTKCKSLNFENKKIVYQGVPGAYSQKAMFAFFGEDAKGEAVDTWREAVEMIANNQVDYAVLPIENSSAGIVEKNYDLLLEYNVTIIGEQIIKVDHALLGLPGASISDITTVYSHPQALMQCSNYLDVKHPQIEKKSMKNTAMSAQKVKEKGDKSCAAIGDVINASLYDLEVIEECIQDNQSNETRFIIVTGEKVYLEDANKISICFQIPHEKGSLYHILSHFIFNGLNMTKIESRPLKGRNWEYQFFIDCYGNLEQPDVLCALLGLQEETSSFCLLGNYVSGEETNL